VLDQKEVQDSEEVVLEEEREALEEEVERRRVEIALENHLATKLVPVERNNNINE